MTNFNKIKSMSVDELAKFLDVIGDGFFDKTLDYECRSVGLMRPLNYSETVATTV